MVYLRNHYLYPVNSYFINISCPKLQVPAGTKELRPPNSSRTFISTPSHSQLMAEMMQSHMAKDICLIGAKVAKA